MNLDKINTPIVSNDSLIFQTSLMKSRVAEDYYFNLEDLDIIYRKLCKKKFHILMNIFEIIKCYLNNNIEYDTVLIIDYKGSIFTIEIDRECENRSDYLRDGEIEICRFGKKVIKKSNIYHDYSKALEEQGISKENLHIWDKWYELDNENIVKKSIVDTNFHQRKNGYIKHYDTLVAGMKKELEIQKIIYS